MSTGQQEKSDARCKAEPMNHGVDIYFVKPHTCFLAGGGSILFKLSGHSWSTVSEMNDGPDKTLTLSEPGDRCGNEKSARTHGFLIPPG